MGLLGTSDYAAQITTRGGGKVLGDVDWETVSYNRISGDTADATVRWCQPDAQVPAFMAETEPWEHDLVIWRTAEPDPVFAGPVRTCTYEEGVVTIVAKDPTAWFERRNNHTDVTYTDRDLAEIYGKIAASLLAQDPSPAIAIITSPCGVTGTRVLRAAESARGADLLRELARSGVDWTAIGRRVLIGGSTLAAGLGTLVLIDDAVASPRLVKAGDNTATRETLRWQTADQTPMLTTVPSRQERILGLLEELVEEPDIADASSASVAAQARLDLFDHNPRVLTCDLTADAPAAVNELIPTRLVDSRVTTLPAVAAGVFRLRRVDVTVDQDKETVSLQATPVGATDE
jgi:hypothetical protein